MRPPAAILTAAAAAAAVATLSGRPCLAQDSSSWEEDFLLLDPSAEAAHFEFDADSGQYPTLRAPEAPVSSNGTAVGRLLYSGPGPAVVDYCLVGYDDGSSPDADVPVVRVDPADGETLLVNDDVSYQDIVTVTNPTSVGVAKRGARTPLSVATLVVVSHGEEGVDVWIALKVFRSLICHLYSVSTPLGQVLQ